jgi:hypothetical protein
LAKPSADELTSVHVIQEQIARAVEKENAAGNGDQVAALQSALAALTPVEEAKAADLATHENAEDVVDEAQAEAAMPLMYASVIGDLAKQAALAKAGKRNSAIDQKTIEQIHDLAVAAGAYADDHKPSAEPDEAAASDDETEKMAKARSGPAPEELAEAVMTYITERVPLAKAADLEAMKAELRAELAKIAAQPMPGGPVRYAELSRFGDEQQSPTASVAAALAKISDPAVREEVGRALATEAIRGIHASPAR